MCEIISLRNNLSSLSASMNLLIETLYLITFKMCKSNAAGTGRKENA